MRVVSLVRYPIQLKSDYGMIKLNAYFGNKMIGDGITQVGDKEWNSAYKMNKAFLDRCQKRGSITWSEFHVDKVEEKDPEEKVSKKQVKKAKKQEAVVEQVEMTEAEYKEVSEEKAPETVEEDALAKADALIEG